MKLIISPKANVNYLAKVVKIDSFRKHSDPKIERLKCCTIDGFNVITSIDSKPGFYVYFPVMCQIHPDFLKAESLYRNQEKNADPSKKGMFEDNGRVKAINLHGEKSEGFVLPATVLENWLLSLTNQEITLTEEIEFDACEHNGKTFNIVKKYTVNDSKGEYHKSSKKGYEISDKIEKGQFNYHYETTLIKKRPYVLTPNCTIHVSEKVHGVSAISACLLCKRDIPWYKKIWSKLTGRKYVFYDKINASRSRILTPRYMSNYSEKALAGTEHWQLAHEIISSALEPGISVYYEIVGYSRSGSYLQKGYDYGYVKPEEDYIYGVHFGVRVYRITYTTHEGVVLEYSMEDVEHWCKINGIPCVTKYYQGTCANLYPDIPLDDNWNSTFINMLANDEQFYMEKMSPSCSNSVPHEGIVIRIEPNSKSKTKSEAFKLKCFKFLGKEQELLDKGISNIEDEA